MKPLDKFKNLKTLEEVYEFREEMQGIVKNAKKPDELEDVWNANFFIKRAEAVIEQKEKKGEILPKID